MYVVVRKYTIAGSSEELIRRSKEELVPIIKGLPGFKAFHIVDCGGQGLMSIGFWESKVAATRSTKAAREWIAKSAQGLAPFPPDKLEGDTVLDLSAEFRPAP